MRLSCEETKNTCKDVHRCLLIWHWPRLDALATADDERGGLLEHKESVGGLRPDSLPSCKLRYLSRRPKRVARPTPRAVVDLDMDDDVGTGLHVRASRSQRE
jgi:hypothetical protein